MKKRNPYVVEYGYHLTHKKELPSILEKGLLPKYRGKRTDTYSLMRVQNLLYDSIRPIYFLDIPNIKKLTREMKDYISRMKYDMILKVDIKNYNQLPDYNSLIIDYGFRYQDEPEDNLYYIDDYYLNNKQNNLIKILSFFYDETKK